MDALKGIFLFHAAFANQPFYLDLLAGICDPNSIALITQVRLEQFDCFNHNDFLTGTACKKLNCLIDMRMNDIFQLCKSLPI